LLLAKNGMSSARDGGTWGFVRKGGEEHPETPLIIRCIRYEDKSILDPNVFSTIVKGLINNYGLIADIIHKMAA
jgi:hypothetical protein